jgi:glucose/arabinose dehydrogenase
LTVGILIVAATIATSISIPSIGHVAAAATTGTMSDTKLVAGLSSPTAMEFSPDGRLFVAEKGGNLRIIKNGMLLSTPFVSIPVETFGERGLLGIAFDPNFSSNGYLYVYFTALNPAIHNRVSRFTADPANPDRALAGSEFPILDLENLGGAWHNGGAIHFGKDGKLYVAVGENGVSSNSQSLSTRLGKMLRINPDGTIPTDNPFYNTTGAKQEIWARGLRNPFTFAFSQSSANPQKMYINDVGQDSWEEIDSGIAGANYGWPICEGMCSYPGFVNPVYTYPHTSTGSRAIVGWAFYEANQFASEYMGSYFFGDYVAGFIKRLTPSGQVIDFLSNLAAPVDIKVGPNDGFLYYLLIGSGEVHQVQYVPSTAIQNPVAVASANPTSGSSPLAVNFDGSGSSNPNAGAVLSYSWNFGDGTPSASGVKVTHTYNAAGPYTATLTVSDDKGGNGTTTVNITVGTPPVGVINQPPEGTKYNAGDTIFFSGSATDAKDGPLPASAFKWVILLHHNTHTHPFLEFDGIKSSNFTIPTISETDSNVWYRIYLTVTDSLGLSQTTTRDVIPNKVNVILDASMPGLQLNLDGQPRIAPYTFVGVVGIIRTLDAPAQQSLNGQTYQFQSWSDGGAETHTISTPSANTTYTARYSMVAPQNYTLTINAFDTSNNVLHMWTTIWAGSNNSSTPLQHGFTSMTFTGNASSTYTVNVSNYKNWIFDHWLDNNSTSSLRTINLGSNTQLTAIYKNVSTPPPTTFNITVKSVDLSGNPIDGKYTTVWSGNTMLTSGFTPMIYVGNSGSMYTVIVADYGKFIFNHWDNGSTTRARDVNLTGDTTMVVYYSTG